MATPDSDAAILASDRQTSIRRREFLRIGLSGLASLSLADLFRLRASAASLPARERKSLIVVWLHGGASHLETYDPKPDAPSEFRGPYKSIPTRVPGMNLSELLPHHAEVADRFTLLRSMVHSGSCHQSGPQQLFTGHPILKNESKPEHPDLFSVVNYLRRDPSRVMLSSVGLNPIPYLGSAYLGQTYEQFTVLGDPNLPEFDVPNIYVKEKGQLERINTRVSLRQSLDGLSRAVDRSGNMQAFDTFQDQAYRVIVSPEVRRAFDISQENARTRDMYGRNTWGQRCLLARRLVEAGVDLVTTTLNGPLCGKANTWDHHAVNDHIFNAQKTSSLYYDQAVAALITDLYQRGLDKKVLLLVTGEFGRTPRISYEHDTKTGALQPGRDHWAHATSMLFSGGGISTGQVIGATDRRGEQVTERRVGIGDFGSTIYRHLGIDAERVSIADFSGRPVPVLESGRPIPELVARG